MPLGSDRAPREMDFSERQKILAWAGGPHDPALIRDELLHEIFEATVDARGNQSALNEAAKTWSYAEVEERANRLARLLRSRGVGRGDYVGLFLPRTANVHIALLAILKSGAAYVPIDPEYPRDRVDFILGDCKVKALLTTGELAGDITYDACAILKIEEMRDEISRQSSVRLSRGDTGATTANAAYVIYTSGSTGRPKGVPITHQSVCNLVRGEARIFGVRETDRVYQGFSIAFDASVEEIWLAFFAGATLVVGTAQMVRAGPSLAKMLRDAGVTVLSCVPTLLTMLQEDLPAVRLLILGGEVCPQDLVKKWSRPNRRMVNTYGPTEATVIATYGDCAPERPVTIGRAAPNYRIYMLAENGGLAAMGEAGELCIVGAGVARGYLNRPELTAEKFIANPFSSEPDYDRLYRTGDLARFTPEGEVEFLGRIDSQVKLRGFRIELSEIEAAMRETNLAVLQAAVTVREDVPGLQELVGYVVTSGAAFDQELARAELRKRLPVFMVPAWIEVVEALPLLPSGKVNRPALPAPTRRLSSSGAEDFAKTETERKIAAAFGRMGLGGFERQADFFREVGVHSLLAARIVSDLRGDADFIDLSVPDMYQHPTLEKLAAAVDLRRSVSAPAAETKKPGIPAPRPPKPKSPGPFNIGQFFSLYIVIGFYSLQWLTPYLTYIWMIEQEETRVMAIFWALGALLVVYPVMLLATIAAKWILVGRMKPGIYPLWGFFHLRWWLMQRILDAVAVEYMEGTPLINMYYRLMGAKIGRGVHFRSYNIGAFDMVSIGEETHLSDATALLGYTIEPGMLRLGPVTIGKRCHIGPGSVLALNTQMEDDARLMHMSLLPEGSRVAAGETWFGSPASRVENAVAAPLPAPLHATPTRRMITAILHAVGIFLLPVVYLAALFPGLILLNEMAGEFGEVWSLLAAPVVAFTFVVLLCLEIVVVKWFFLGRVKPGNYSLHGWFYLRKWFVDQLMALSLDVMGPLYATMYLNPWYRLLGAKMGRRAEISTACAASPDLLEIGEESFIADAALLGAPTVAGGLLTLKPTRIGRRAFVGNSALLMAGEVIGDNTLVGVLTTPPLEKPGAAQPDTVWLGSPAIFLPQRQASTAFSEAATYKPPRKLVLLRLAIEFCRIILPITMFVVFTSLLITSVVVLDDYLEEWVQILLFPFLYFAAGLAATLFTIAAKWILVGRYKESEKPLWSTFVWRSELVNALHENLAGAYLMDMLEGTPLVAWYLRAMGMKIGRRVYLDTSEFTEFDLVKIGDDATLNTEATIQTHLFEDRVMKMSRVTIGKRCSVGACAVVLYDTEMADGAVLEELSLVMKGETLPAGTRWRGSPAQAG